ncbi:hypothetical protein ACFX1X_005635 [Malus domestica]
MKEQSNQSFQDLASVEFSLLTLSSSCSFATQASVYSWFESLEVNFVAALQLGKLNRLGLSSQLQDTGGVI